MKRKDCQCLCHIPGAVMLHCIPCCEPDEDLKQPSHLDQVADTTTGVNPYEYIGECDMCTNPDCACPIPVKIPKLKKRQGRYQYTNNYGHEVYSADYYAVEDVEKYVKKIEKLLRKI